MAHPFDQPQSMIDAIRFITQEFSQLCGILTHIEYEGSLKSSLAVPMNIGNIHIRSSIHAPFSILFHSADLLQGR